MVRIKLNGSNYLTGCQTAFAVRDEYDASATVIIYNGFQLTQDCRISDGDILHIISKDRLPAEDVLESMMAARHTPSVHEKLKHSRAAIAGLGGLGSNIAVMLARIGVGHLLLVDFDIVEPSNLNRQCYYISHLGLSKTEALQDQLNQINPYIQVETKNIRVTPSNAVELFSGYPVVCEAFDHPASKAALINTLLENAPECKLVAASGMAGYGSSNDIQTRRVMKNLYLCGDMLTEAAPGCGLMAPRVQICAGHQANMILRLLIGIEDI